MDFKAAIRQILEEPRDGILITLILLRNWRVLDHFMIMWAPGGGGGGGANITSALANCFI